MQLHTAGHSLYNQQMKWGMLTHLNSHPISPPNPSTQATDIW